MSPLASAAGSGLELIAAMGTFWAVRVAVAPADAEQRYGHGKAEGFASLLQADLVFASAALIANEAVRHLLHPVPVREEGGATIVMFVSVSATLLLVGAQAKVIESTRSVAIKGDRAHYLARPRLERRRDRRHRPGADAASAANSHRIQRPILQEAVDRRAPTGEAAQGMTCPPSFFSS